MFLANEGGKENDCQTCCRSNKSGNHKLIIQVRQPDEATDDDAQNNE